MFMPQMLNGDGDIGRHLTVGKWILDTGQVPTRDIFSDTMPGELSIPHEWLSQVLFALAHRLAGLNGVAWLTALVLATTYAALAEALRRFGVNAVLAGVSGIAASIISAIHQLTRPHIFTFLFFALFVIILEHYRRDAKWRMLLFLLPLMLVWANLHGAFVTGLVLVGFYAAGAFLDKNYRAVLELGMLVVALLIVACINPAGVQLIGNSFGYLQGRFLVDMTHEYQSPNFHGVNAFPFLALIALALVIGWRVPQRLSWSGLISVVGWMAFALYSARNIPLAASITLAVIVPIADDWLARVLPRVKNLLTRLDVQDRQASGWIWAGVIVVALIAVEANGIKLDLWNKGNVFDSRRFPIAAVDSFASAPPAGAMFNEFTWGGYLLYRLYPTRRVFIDGQTDFYGEALSREYWQIINAQPGWESKLAAHHVRWILIPPTTPLTAWLDQSPNWSRMYQDETAGVWIKKELVE